MLLLRASLSLTLLLAALASASPCAIPLAGLHTSSSVLDLEPLLARRREVARAVLTPPSLTTTVYAWGDCAHGIGHDGQLPDFEQVRLAHGPSLRRKDRTLTCAPLLCAQCPPSTLVCMTGSNSRPNHRAEPPRIVSVAAVAASLKGASARLVPRSDSEYGASLIALLPGALLPGVYVALMLTLTPLAPADIEVTLLGEDYVHERQTVEILLVCDPSAPEVRPLARSRYLLVPRLTLSRSCARAPAAVRSDVRQRQGRRAPLRVGHARRLRRGRSGRAGRTTVGRAASRGGPDASPGGGRRLGRGSSARRHRPPVPLVRSSASSPS